MTDKKFERKLREYQSKPHRRAITLERDGGPIDEDARTAELVFSSEEPYERWFGFEVLGHKDGEVEMSRLEDGAAVLRNHDPDQHIGVVEKAWIDGDKGRAVVRFGNSSQAQEAFQDVADGVLRHISVGYFVREMVLAEQSKDGPDSYRVSLWEPFEISAVAVPADTSAGIGKSLDEFVEEIETKEEKVMSDKDTKTGDEAARKVELDSAVSDAQERAQAQERNRVSELLKIGEKYGAEDLARECVNSGESVDELNRKILERGGLELTKAEGPEIGMSEKEVKRFSFLRFLNALAHPSDPEAQRAAAFELECAAEASNVSKKEARGAMIPYDVLVAKRDMNVGTPGDGGNLVETVLDSASFIDILQNRLALVQCGITMLPGLNGNIAIPRQTGGASHFWLAENGTPSESSATFDQIAMSPKTVGAYTEISRRLLKQSSIPAESFAVRELARVLALAIDLAGINGSGAGNEPLGILNYPGIGDVAGGTNGGDPSWDDIVDLETAVASANADVGSLCYLTNAKVRGKTKRTFIDAGSGERIWDRSDTPLNGYRAVVSNQVPSDLDKGTSTGVCSAVIFGNFADHILGMWGGLDLQVNPYSLDTSGAVRVTAFQDVDMQIRHPESFAAMKDALTV